MKLLGFSLKSEPIWMLVFSVAPVVLGVLASLVVLILKRGR
jgi:hypothetical protein